MLEDEVRKGCRIAGQDARDLDFGFRFVEIVFLEGADGEILDPRGVARRITINLLGPGFGLAARKEGERMGEPGRGREFLRLRRDGIVCAQNEFLVLETVIDVKGRSIGF